jgi:hypothetical protein
VKSVVFHLEFRPKRTGIQTTDFTDFTYRTKRKRLSHVSHVSLSISNFDRNELGIQTTDFTDFTYRTKRNRNAKPVTSLTSPTARRTAPRRAIDRTRSKSWILVVCPGEGVKKIGDQPHEATTAVARVPCLAMWR